jgi:hypothetical protein
VKPRQYYSFITHPDGYAARSAITARMTTRPHSLCRPRPAEPENQGTDGRERVTDHALIPLIGQRLVVKLFKVLKLHHFNPLSIIPPYEKIGRCSLPAMNPNPERNR